MYSASFPAAIPALRDCLRFLLAEPPSPAPWALPAEVAPSDFASAARRHRVVPLLAASLHQLLLPVDLAAAFREEGQAGRLRCLRQANELARLSMVLRAAEVPMLVFKGLPLATQTYGDFAARGVGDHDLLVRPTDLSRARTALADAGWRAELSYPTPGDGWPWRHLLRNGYEMQLCGPASVIDLHWRLDPTLAALPAFDQLWRRRSTLTIAGAEIATLGVSDALLHSCSHAAKDDWRWLRSLADVVSLTRRPDVWTGPDTPQPRPVHLQTLGIATAMLGSPADLPEPLRMRARRAAASRLALAEERQAAPVRPAVDPFPGLSLLDITRRHARGSRAPADLLRIAMAATVPTTGFEGLAGKPLLTTAFHVLRRRSGRFRDRLRAWQAAR